MHVGLPHRHQRGKVKKREQKGEKTSKSEEVSNSAVRLCSSGRRQSSHCDRINTSSQPCTLLTRQLLPRVTETRANSTKCTTSKHVFRWVRGSGTGGRDPLSASKAPPPHPHHHKWGVLNCCFRRFITVSRGTRWTARDWRSMFWWMILVLLTGCSVFGQYM